MKLLYRTRMRTAHRTLIVSALALGLTVAGCGGSSTQSSTRAAGEQTQGASTASSSTHQTSGRSGHLPLGSIEVSIPSLVENQIPKVNTCDGANTPLPLQWSNIPSSTAELAVFVLSLRHGKAFVDWAVTGLSPASQGISGTLPAGAVVARNSFGNVGYSICPPKGTRETFVVRVEALPQHLATRSGGDGRKLYQEAGRISTNLGIVSGVYTRS
jgi:phosphatidylethanolamine-binding protein (PEBP) family uncharacterized protein